LRILVVEDDVKLARLIQKGMKEQGLGVDLAHDLGEGMAMALAIDYDAVLLDLNLPGGDGLVALKDLRSRGRTTPVLVLTARSSVEDRVHGLDSGADDYLAKPFHFEELMARLRAITRRPAVEPKTLLVVGDLQVDLSSHRVVRQGQRIDLTAKEFSLLAYLARKAGVVVTRGMILDHVWDMDYDGGSNLVEVYINYLRRKIDHPFESKLLHTVRGAGYVLREGE